MTFDYPENSWALKNWCFWTVELERTLESPLNCKEIQPVHPKGNQSWIFIGRTDAEAEGPVFWPPDVKNWLIGKDPDAGKDWRQEEKGLTENKMVELHHQLDAHEFEQVLGVWWWTEREAWHAAVRGVENSWTQLSDWTELIVNNASMNTCILVLARIHIQRRQWHPTPVLLPRKSHGWRSLVGCSLWGR